MLVHDTVQAPFTFGFLRPIILLPVCSEHWSPNRRAAVLLHEMAHIARGDYVGLCESTVACALYWFHPAICIAARAMQAEGERAVDDCVLHANMSALEFATHLLALAESVQINARDKTPSAAVRMARTSQLEWRLRALFDSTRSRVA